MRRLLLVACLAVAGCSQGAEPGRSASSSLIPAGPANPEAPGDHPPGRWLDHDRAPDRYLAQMKEVIRRHASLMHGPDCGTVAIPDAAFFPIEMTGGFAPELAVSLGYAECGPAPNSYFGGNTGIPVQFWSADGGRPRLLLEQVLHGFTPGDRRLVVVGHGGACRVTGTDPCRTTYRWDEIGRRLEAAERKPFSALPPQPEAAYFGNELLGTGPCDARQAALPLDQRRCGR